jgi:uncharacterized protein (DUF1810 family)
VAQSFDLDRFVAAQAPVYAAALQELRRGRKASHWMWFIFPQLAGLGRSPTAQHFAIRSLGEARAYLAHPILGERLRTATEAVLEHGGTPAETIFGSVDAMKLRSSMTLFARAADDPALFEEAISRFFGGEEDLETIRLLNAAGDAERPCG